MSEYGYIRQLNKRKNEGPKPRPSETVIDVDRNNRVLGNPFPLEDKDDEVARARVIGLYNEKLEADFAIGGPMFTAVKAIARRVIAGEKIGLNCWCVPCACHSDIIAKKIVEMVQEVQPDNPVLRNDPPPPPAPKLAEFEF